MLPIKLLELVLLLKLMFFILFLLDFEVLTSCNDILLFKPLVVVLFIVLFNELVLVEVLSNILESVKTEISIFGGGKI